MAQRRTKAGRRRAEAAAALAQGKQATKQPTRWLLLRVPLFSCACFICHARLHGTLLSELEWQRCEEADQCIFNHNKLWLWGQPRPFAKEENKHTFLFPQSSKKSVLLYIFQILRACRRWNPPLTHTHTTSLDGIKKENLILVTMWFQITILYNNAFFFLVEYKKETKASKWFTVVGAAVFYVFLFFRLTLWSLRNVYRSESSAETLLFSLLQAELGLAGG